MINYHSEGRQYNKACWEVGLKRRDLEGMSHPLGKEGWICGLVPMLGFGVSVFTCVINIQQNKDKYQKMLENDASVKFLCSQDDVKHVLCYSISFLVLFGLGFFF